MEESPSHQPHLSTPAIMTTATPYSDQAQYWCYQCNKRVSAETLADQSEVVCGECNNGFVELISSIEVSMSSDHFNSSQFSQFIGLHSQATVEEEGDDDDDDSEEDDEDDEDEEDDTDDESEEEEQNIENETAATENSERVEEGSENENENDIRVMLTNLLRRYRHLPESRQHYMRLRMATMLVRHLVRLTGQDEEGRDYDNENDTIDLLRMIVEDSLNGRRGAPPASKSAVSTLKTVNVKVEKDCISCAICQDSVNVGQIAKELGCGHRFHGECIFPWLAARNTCPLCRFELPTDDGEYEAMRKKNATGSSASGTIDSRLE